MPERIRRGWGLRAFYEPGQRNWGARSSARTCVWSPPCARARALSRSTSGCPRAEAWATFYIVPAGALSEAQCRSPFGTAQPGAEAWVYLTPEPGWEIWISMKSAGCGLPGFALVDLPRLGIVQVAR